MRIELEIPDGMIESGRMIHIMAGRERVAYKPWNGEWQVKYSRCSMCGECCRAMECPYVVEIGSCGIEWLPFRCATTEPNRVEQCTSRYRVV